MDSSDKEKIAMILKIINVSKIPRVELLQSTGMSLRAIEIFAKEDFIAICPIFEILTHVVPFKNYKLIT